MQLAQKERSLRISFKDYRLYKQNDRPIDIICRVGIAHRSTYIADRFFAIGLKHNDRAEKVKLSINFYMIHGGLYG